MKTRIRRLRAVPYLAALTLLCALSDAHADSAYGRPIYNPATKSYFELRADNTVGNWIHARQRAEALAYKGARGRLAVVPSLEAHMFLARNFKIDVETWIGLRYWCTFRKMTWSDGQAHEHGAFGPWSPSWDRKDWPACQGAGTRLTGYMPVYYTPTKRGFKWQAVGSAKGFARYFVEYPVGHE